MKPAGPQGSLRRMLGRAQLWTRAHLPPGLRLVAGLALMVGGVFGFLPVLGFWMIPLGVAVAALDVVPIWRALFGHPGATETKGPDAGGAAKKGPDSGGEGVSDTSGDTDGPPSEG